MAKQKGAQKSGASAKAQAPKPQRQRITFRFQLDIARDNVEFFMQLQQWLAAKRVWKRYAMEGLRLFYDLSQGSTVVLLELFPNIKEMLGVTPPDDGGLRDEIRELRRMMLEQGGQTIQPQTLIMKSAADAPKAEVKAAVAMDASDITDNFLAMFQ